eukprot:scaffold31724_cov59-Phaeocystis_antarctica.AAC.1
MTNGVLLQNKSSYIKKQANHSVTQLLVTDSAQPPSRAHVQSALLYHVDVTWTRPQRTFAAPFSVAHPQLALPPKQPPSPIQPCPVKPFLPWAAHPNSRPCRLGSSRTRNPAP